MLRQRPPPSAASQVGGSKGRGWGVSHQCLDRKLDASVLVYTHVESATIHSGKVFPHFGRSQKSTVHFSVRLP